MKLFIFLTLAVSFYTASSSFSFNGYKLIRLIPTQKYQLDKINEWQHNPEFDVWTNRIKGLNKSVDVLLSPVQYFKYKKLFSENNLNFSVLDSNIQNKIENQKRSMIRNKRNTGIVGKFARYTEIMDYIDQVVTENPTLASSKVAGKTYQNRLLKALILKTSTSSKSIFIDCGIHAREWISVSSCIWIINSLVSEYKSNDPTTVKILNNYEIHILPVLNPDGYEYSWNSYRMWRKNRTPNSGSSCIGTDLNRNFGFQWMTGGSSSNPCSDTYAGKSADSELETKLLESYLLSKSNWESYITIHTFGNWWFTPWSYTPNLPSDYQVLFDKAQIGADGIKSVYGTEYEIGSSADLLYINSGPSDDWAKGKGGIKYSYTLELAPGNSGPDSDYGFMLPEDRAPGVGTEVYAGIKRYINSFL